MNKKSYYLFSCLVAGGLLFFLTPLGAQDFAPHARSGLRVHLPNGWSLTPAGKSIPLSSDLPLNMALSPDGKLLAVTNNGDGVQDIDLISLPALKLVSSHVIGKSWLGLQFSPDGKSLYVSGGNDDIIIRFRVYRDRLLHPDTLFLGKPWPVNKISPTGLALDPAHHCLYVVTKEDDALYILNLSSGKILRRVPLSAEAYTCLLNYVRQELYISLWGGRKILIWNTATDSMTDSISTGDHPNDMALSSNGQDLYVAESSANAVSVIDLEHRRVLESLNAALYPASPIGSTTNSVALSSDDRTLYIANADNNCLAVFDVSDPGHSRSLGFIPVGWYPTCVRVWGNQLLVTNGKGMSSMANPLFRIALTPGDRTRRGKNPGGSQQEYIGSLFKGSLSLIPEPDHRTLARYSREVYANTPFHKQREMSDSIPAGNPIPARVGWPSPIKYVFYIIKENRTYDQVLGDIREANGEDSLCIFGEKITPNEHALAKEFVLFDNFYVDGEVSADGHNWSMGAYATDFVEKTWPSNYSGRGGNYDFQGNRPIANPTLGFLWDYCQRAGISQRDYGEFVENGRPSLPVLSEKGHFCPAYPGWNLRIQDIYRERIFEHDFDSLLAIGRVAHLNTIYLPDDHTSGLQPGAFTPIAQVADNDLALGRLVDHISHSSIWKQSAIFVLEDDAQNGPDHVDAHRSTAFVISPYIKRHLVDHTMYSTTGMLRTIELILGLPPMSQYDAAATPLWDCFTATADLSPYLVHPAQVDINSRNPAQGPGARVSAGFDLSRPDAVPDQQLNQVIWESVKGPLVPMPVPQRSAFVRVSKPKVGGDGDGDGDGDGY